MDIKRKLEFVEQAVRSVSTHEDEDAALRKAALDHVIAVCEREKTAIDQAVQAAIDAQVG